MLAVLETRCFDFKSIKIVLKGDNSFYSQRGSDYFPDRLRDQPDFSVPINPRLKTGLGSSAAMAVSFLAALLHALGF